MGNEMFTAHHVRDPVSKVYKISESMMALMLREIFSPVRELKRRIGGYLSASVRLVWRRPKRDTVIKMSATDDIDSPRVNTHYV